MARIQPGYCVRLPDGRLGRFREVTAGGCKVRVRRPSGRSNTFLDFAESYLEVATCPKGWMSPIGYLRYLAEVHAAQPKRQARDNARHEPAHAPVHRLGLQHFEVLRLAATPSAHR